MAERKGADFDVKYEGFYREDDRTGFKVRARDTVQEWNGAIVDKRIVEERHPQEFLRSKADRQAVTKARPPAPDIQVGPLTTEIAADAVAGASSVTLGSTSRYVIGNRINLILDDGDAMVVAITNIAGNVVTLARALPASATTGNRVVNYDVANPAPPLR